MFKQITILFLVLSFGYIYSQWSERVSGVTVQLTSVSAIDNNNTWVCGYSGTVLRTTNQGFNWMNVSGNGIPSTIQLINVWGIDANTALVAGYIGSDTWVYRTSNAGANWTQVFTETGGFINGLVIRLDGSGFMTGDPVGGRWSLWKTNNNGVTWDSTGLYLVQSGSETGYNNCVSVAIKRIWFGTNNSRIYYSSNNGANWSIQTASPETQITAIWFDMNGSATGYCGGNNIHKTTNYGANWVSIGGPGTGLILGVAGLTMWGGNLWYVRSGSSVIYFGYGEGTWFSQHTAPAGTYRHVTTDRIPNQPFLGYAVRTNGGISFTQIFVQGIKNLGGEIPESFSLSQNFPNPFNPNTKIRFAVTSLDNGLQPIVQLKLFDVLGREVATLVNEQLQPGTYEAEFDGIDFPSGVYYYTLEADPETSSGFREMKKMVLIK